MLDEFFQAVESEITDVVSGRAYTEDLFTEQHDYHFLKTNTWFTVMFLYKVPFSVLKFKECFSIKFTLINSFSYDFLVKLPRIDSTWEGELGSDRWLRGSWRSSSSSGRWRARHIGRQAVHQLLGVV